MCVCFELWIRYDFIGWFEATLEYGRIGATESCGLLMISNYDEKDHINLLETLKDKTVSHKNTSVENRLSRHCATIQVMYYT